MQTTSLQFIAFDQAHIPHLQTSAGMAQVLLDTLKTKPLFTITGNRVHMLPLKNLTGILAPQIALELSVHNPKKIKDYTKSLADAIWAMIQFISPTNVVAL